MVVNDDGGSIFAVLEQGAPAYADRYDRLFGTPHGVDLAACVPRPGRRTGGWSRCPSSAGAGQPNGGIEVVEVRCRRDNRRALDEAIRALAHTRTHCRKMPLNRSQAPPFLAG